MLLKAQFTLLFVLTGPLFGEILFEDDFNDGSAADWNVISGNWFVNDSLRYETDEAGLSWNGDSSGVMSETNYSVVAKVISNTATGLAVVLVRATGSSTWAAQRCQLYFEDDEVSLIDFDGNGIASTSYALSSDEPYWILFECFGDSLRAKVWTGTVEDEPSLWLLQGEGAFPEHSHEGSVGVYCWDIGGGAGEFDDILVETVELRLEASTWGGVKAWVQE